MEETESQQEQGIPPLHFSLPLESECQNLLLYSQGAPPLLPERKASTASTASSPESSPIKLPVAMPESLGKPNRDHSSFTNRNAYKGIVRFLLREVHDNYFTFEDVESLLIYNDFFFGTQDSEELIEILP